MWTVISLAEVASQRAALLEQARRPIRPLTAVGTRLTLAPMARYPEPAAAQLYHTWLQRLRIPQRFPQPDWSIADKWVAKELLRRNVAPATVAGILQGGSPGFPRRHADPLDYLRRTLAQAWRELSGTRFPPPGGPVWRLMAGSRMAAPAPVEPPHDGRISGQPATMAGWPGAGPAGPRTVPETNNPAQSADVPGCKSVR